jgi:hypothetical protein
MCVKSVDLPKVCPECKSKDWNKLGKTHDLTKIETTNEVDLEQLELNHGITANQVYKNGK